MSEIYNRDDNDDIQAEKFRKLFIGGLNSETTEESLKQHFEKWGEIVDCVVMKNSETQKSRGFGFITYKTAEMLDDAQNNRPHKIDDRELDTKRATPRDSNGPQTSVNKMFVGGLKDDIAEDDVKEVFGHFGKIEKLEMIKDKNTGKHKGFCFITFDDFDSVDKCVLRGRISLGGKSVEVRKAVPKDAAGGMGGGRGGGRGGSRGGMRSRGGFGDANSNGYNNGYGYQGNGVYSDNPKGYGSGGHQGYGSINQGGYGGGGNQGGYGGGHQGYGGGNQGGYGGSGHQGYGGGNQGGYSSGMGGRYGGSGGDYNNSGSGFGGGPTRGARFAQKGAGPYGNGYGRSGMGGYKQ